MSVAVARNNDGLLSGSVCHASKASLGIFVRYGVGVLDIKPLLQIHAGAEGLVPRPGEDGAPQLGLRVVPSPQEPELNGSLYGQTIPILWPVDSDEQDMFAWERHQAVL